MDNDFYSQFGKRVKRLRVKQAYKLLSECGVTTAPIRLEPIADYLGATIQEESFDGDRGDLSGMVFKHRGRIIIGINSEHSENRKRFTIAHELGHIVLHQLDEIHIDKQFPLKLRDDISSQAIDPEEMEANAFAAALLMPEAMLKADLAAMEEMDCESDEDIQKLAIKYAVSPQAMNFRLMNLGLVSPVS